MADGIGFRIFNRIHRAPATLVAQFRGLPVANIADEMNRGFCLDAPIRPMNQAPLLGVAFTVRVRPGDNLMLHRAIDMAEPGDVIMVDAQGELANAISGELMMAWAARRGVAGVVVDGAMRDADVIGRMALPVYARGITPRGPYKSGPGEINVPIACGGVVVHPGDIVVGDADGVVVIPRREAEAVLERARRKQSDEAATREAIDAGTWNREAYSDEKLRAMGCAIIDGAYGD
jgi:RraA family protein